MKCKFCRKAILFWQHAQFVPMVERPNLWTCGGMAHSLCFDAYSEGFSDGEAAATPQKKEKKHVGD